MQAFFTSPCLEIHHQQRKRTKRLSQNPNLGFARARAKERILRQPLRPNPTEPGERQNSHTDPATIGPHQQFRGSTILLYGENTEKGRWQANVATPEGKEVWDVDYRVVAPGLIDTALSPRERIPSTQQGRECPPEAAAPGRPVSRSAHVAMAGCGRCRCPTPPLCALASRL